MKFSQIRLKGQSFRLILSKMFDDLTGDLASKYNELASKYNELASKYNKIASFPLIITGSENDNSIKRCKLFI